MTVFDDHLGLAGRDLTPFRLILFHGRSGSGKSTAIRFLLENSFRDRPVEVVDEIGALRDLFRMRALLRNNVTLLVATHVHPFWFRLLAPGRMLVFHTDRDPSKIARHLARLGVSATPAAVQAYVGRFGATYTDAELIMERWPSPIFDHSLARFLKFDRIE
ncbi:MAG TPA: hypothetical protein VNA04_15355 [Thermoanaerobaculia bacterium]|nr:hypothetical protein [Thermoanaerobaculia bacterium]